VVCIVGIAFAVVVGPWMSASQVVAYRTLLGEEDRMAFGEGGAD
jgi:hypothetical protein